MDEWLFFQNNPAFLFQNRRGVQIEVKHEILFYLMQSACLITGEKLSTEMSYREGQTRAIISSTETVFKNDSNSMGVASPYSLLYF